MNDVSELIAKHRTNGVLVDTNLLVLLLVGRTNKRRIINFKRTQSYVVEDYEILEDFVAKFGKTIVTPHILTEASNLANLSGQESTEARRHLYEYIGIAEERSASSRVLSSDPAFPRLGLTDAGVAALATACLVLTDDLDLYSYLGSRAVDAVNLNHIRPGGWT
jgi:hypothetical protein